jgi:hypothetical protein
MKTLPLSFDPSFDIQSSFTSSVCVICVYVFVAFRQRGSHPHNVDKLLLHRKGTYQAMTSNLSSFPPYLFTFIGIAESCRPKSHNQLTSRTGESLQALNVGR